MTIYVVDTNVMLVANGAHDGVSLECVECCATKLQMIQRNSKVAIDDEFRILSEYQKKILSKRAKGPGDVFLKWLLQNSANKKHCHQVTLTETSPDDFEEFPKGVLPVSFDRQDRKFVAIANAHPRKPAVLQASDCKWLDWNSGLKACGIKVEFLCHDDVCRFYSKKFPRKTVPEL